VDLNNFIDLPLERKMSAHAFHEGNCSAWILDLFSDPDCRKVVEYCKRHGKQELGGSTANVLGIGVQAVMDCIMVEERPNTTESAKSAYRVLHDLAMRRKQWRDTVERQNDLRDFSKDFAKSEKPWLTLEERVEYFRESKKTRGKGIKFGWSYFDDFIGGLGSKKVFTVAAGSGIGKTALAMNMLQRACAHNHGLRAIFFSFEMDEEQHAKREIEIYTGMDPRDTYHAVDQKAFQDSYLTDNPLSRMVVDYRAKSLREMADHVKLYREEFGSCSLVAIDYLQFVRRERDHDVNRQMEEIKQWAKEMDVAVILLAQLDKAAARNDRETGKPVRPNGFDALGGVGIMNNSDFLLSMWRENETELRAKFSKARTMHNVSLRGVEYRIEMRGLTIDDFNPISQASE
jgi:KaiC/GvpD/RAD55 family RecA-like ATPase